MHWQTGNTKDFFPRSEDIQLEQLPPGIYIVLKEHMSGYYFSKVEDKSDLIKFENTVSNSIIKEINSFWKKKDLFEHHGFPFRRGILFYGPPGSGKSCAIKMILKDVESMGGIGIIFNNFNYFSLGMELFRTIQPDTPVVVVMEDLEGLLNSDYESEILNMLDGIGGFTNIVFLATTNYFDNLEERVKNRPSRFDKCVKIDYPTRDIRFKYLEHLIGKSEEFSHLPISEWADGSEGLSMAHLKELFISVVFFDADYRESINRLQHMGLEETTEYEEDEEDS